MSELPENLSDIVKKEPFFERLNGLPNMAWLRALEEAADAQGRALLFFVLLPIVIVLMLVATLGVGVFILPFVYGFYLYKRVKWQRHALSALDASPWTVWDFETLSYREFDEYVPIAEMFKRMGSICSALITLFELTLCLGFVALFIYVLAHTSFYDLGAIITFGLVLLLLKVIFFFIEMSLPLCYLYLVMRFARYMTVIFGLIGLLAFVLTIGAVFTIVSLLIGGNDLFEFFLIVMACLAIVSWFLLFIFSSYLMGMSEEIKKKRRILINIHQNMKQDCPHLCPPEVLSGEVDHEIKEVKRPAVLEGLS